MSRTASATEAASVTRADTAEFNHKATLTLASASPSVVVVRGKPAMPFRKGAAVVLDVSERTVRQYLSQPLAEYEAERQAVQERQAVETGNRDGKPFRFGFVSSEDAAADWRSKGLRSEIRELLGQGCSQADIARYLGRSRQIVSHHARALRVAATVSDFEPVKSN